VKNLKIDLEMENKYGFSREEVIGVLSKYVPNERLEQFVKDHESQIADLQKGNISGVFAGFQKRGKPDETYDARISLKRQKEENTEKEFITPTFTFKNKVLKVPKSFTLDGVQVQLTEQQYNDLVNEGRLSETLKFTGHSGIEREMFVAVDRELNRIAWIPASFFRVPDSLYQTTLSQEQKDALVAGKKAQLEIDFKGGKKTVSAYYDPVLHKIRFEQAGEQPKMSETTEGEKESVETKSEQTEKKKPSEKLEGKQKQQTKDMTVSKGKTIVKPS
jgi:hypothetical protein